MDAAQDQKSEVERAPIRRVRSWFEGGMIRRAEALQLCGGVLVYHCQSATDVGSVYFPARAFSVEKGRRFDGRILIRGLLILLAYLIFGGPLMVAAAGLAVEKDLQYYWVALFWAGLVLCAMAAVGLFLIPRPTTRFIADTDDWSVVLEFWHRRGNNPSLDALVARLRRHSRSVHRTFPFPVTLSHDWTVAYPVRATVLYVIGLYCSLWIAITLARYGIKVFGWNWSLPAGISWILLAPLFLGLLYLLRNQLVLGNRGREYRAAMDAFLREDYREAEDKLETMLGEHPLDLEALLLLIHVHLRRDAFDHALQCCTLLRNVDPELSDEMAEQLWVIRRMHESEQPAG